MGGVASASFGSKMGRDLANDAGTLSISRTTGVFHWGRYSGTCTAAEPGKRKF